jgi:hypothetical protein
MYTSKPFLDASSPQSFGGVIIDGEVIEGGWKESGFENVTIKKKDGLVVSLNDSLEKVVCELWPRILGADLKDGW